MHNTDRVTRDLEAQLHELGHESFEFHEMHEGEDEYHEAGLHEMHEAGGHELHEDEFHEAGMHEAGIHELHEDELTGSHELHEDELHEAGAHEMGHEWEMHESHEVPLQESEVMELASEFLEITNEDELEQFLGRLIRRVGRGIGRIARSPIGKMIGGVLKPLAKAALPLAGKALGGFVGGPLGAMVGGKLASMASNAMGLEFEGMSHEDREFEVARRFVQFASNAARNAMVASPRVAPQAAVRRAVATAARRYAPGLIRLAATGTVAPVAAGGVAPARRRYCRCGRPLASRPAVAIPGVATAATTPAYPVGVPYSSSRGRGSWVRRGNRIILIGA